MWYLNLSVDCSYLVNKLNLRRETSMYAQYFVFYDSSQRQVIESLITIFPWSTIPILLQHLIIEPIHLSNLS